MHKLFLGFAAVWFGVVLAGCGGDVPREKLSHKIPISVTTGSSVPPKTSEQSPPDPNVIVPITWKDLDIGMEPDAKFESWMLTSKAKACLNRKVRITGFMHGGVYSAEKIRTFFLKCELECPFGAGGQAHHHIEVELQGKLRTPFRTNSLTVEGLLTLRPHEGPDGATWSLYHLEGTKIE